MFDDNTTDRMLARVTHCAFKKAGTMMVLNVDSGATDNVQPSQKKVRQYKIITSSTDIVRYIIERAMEIHPAST